MRLTRALNVFVRGWRYWRMKADACGASGTAGIHRALLRQGEDLLGLLHTPQAVAPQIDQGLGGLERKGV